MERYKRKYMESEDNEKIMDRWLNKYVDHFNLHDLKIYDGAIHIEIPTSFEVIKAYNMVSAMVVSSKFDVKDVEKFSNKQHIDFFVKNFKEDQLPDLFDKIKGHYDSLSKKDIRHIANFSTVYYNERNHELEVEINL